MMLKSLQWRQVYQNLDHYRYEFEHVVEDLPRKSLTFEIKQILNGEMKGLGTGTFVWPAAHIMGKYLEIAYGKSKLSGMHVCDIGSGTGITGFIAAYLGADVVLTDQACVLDLLQSNTDQFVNFIKDQSSEPFLGSLAVHEYDWELKNSVSDRDFDLLLISDCVLPKLYPIDLLVDAVEHLIGAKTVAIFSYEHRPYALFDPRQEFQRLCELRGLVVTVIPLSEHHSIYRAEDIELWEVRRISPLGGDIMDNRSKLLLHCWGEDKECIRATLTTSIQDCSQLPQQIIPLTIKQSQVSGSGIGSFLWASSVIASRLLIEGKWLPISQQNTDDDSIPICLDIGAGCGLTSMVAHHLGYNVIATDRSSLVHGLLQENIQEYLQSAAFKSILDCRSLDWESVSPTNWNDQLQISPSQRIRYIICSDCLYSSPAVQPLLYLLDYIALREFRLLPGELSEQQSVTIRVLVVNELRSALEEFLYFALHRSDPSISVQIQEIPISAPDLVLLRSAEAFHVAPPLRACLLSWTVVSIAK
jgi:predicted nicotinamide N-methyase